MVIPISMIKGLLQCKSIVLFLQWSIYRLQLILNDDAYINDERLKTMRGYADNANTDGTCFAYGDAFIFIETVEVGRMDVTFVAYILSIQTDRTYQMMLKSLYHIYFK